MEALGHKAYCVLF